MAAPGTRSSVEKEELVEELPSTSNEDSELVGNAQVMTEALRNPLVLSTVLENLKFDSLSNCRFVSRLWHQMASNTMRKLDCCLMYLELDLHYEDLTILPLFQPLYNGSCCYGPEGFIRFPPLTRLNSILQKSSHFPCTHLKLYADQDCSMCDCESHNESEILARKTTLMQLQREGIKTLQFDINGDASYSVELNLFQRFLKSLPNLETLILDRIYFKEEEELSLDINDFLLPSLKIIQNKDAMCPDRIVRAAINLRKFHVTSVGYSKDEIADIQSHLETLGKMDVLYVDSSDDEEDE